MLEIIREYAAEQLHRAGERDTTRARHFHYFCELARTSSIRGDFRPRTAAAR
ncbi:MAG: hypothetical protein R3E12_18720 [Candidatus Eisenbacteria bacterium]